MIYYLFPDGGSYYIENGPLICRDMRYWYEMKILIYVIGTSVLKEINGGIHSKVVILYLFSKNYGKHTKDLYILDLISNSLQLDLKEISIQQGSSSHRPSAKDTDVIWKVIIKKITAGSIPKTSELLRQIDCNKRIILTL